MISFSTKTYAIRKICFRSQRIAQEIKKSVSCILQDKINGLHTEIVMLTVSDVKISNDLSHAKIFVTFLNYSFLLSSDKYQEKEAINRYLKILQDSSSFIRYLLGKSMSNLRIVPKLVFLYDTSLIEGIRISHLIKNIIKNDNDKKSSSF